MLLLQRLRELDSEAKRSARHLALVGLPALAITTLFFGPPLSWVWGRTIVHAGSTMFSVPSGTGSDAVEYRLPGRSEVIRFRFGGRERDWPNPVPIDRWGEPSSMAVCDLRNHRPLEHRALNCPGNFFEERFIRPTVWFPPPQVGGRLHDRLPSATIPIKPGIYAIAELPLPLAEQWPGVALDAAAYLRSLEASPAERLYSRVGSVLRGILTVFGSLLVLTFALLIVYPPIGLALLALLPAVWLSTEKKRLENTVAAATGHELAGSGDTLRRGQAHVRYEPGHADGLAGLPKQ